MKQHLTSLKAEAVEADQVSRDLLCWLKATADQLRLDTLRVLQQNSYGVLELCEILACKQSGLSHHLKILAQAGLVTTRREGNSIFYRRNHIALNQQLEPMQHNLFASIDQLPLDEQVEKRLDNIQKQRSAESERFFASNADKFQAQQDLIASYEGYADAVTEVINSHSLTTNSNQQALELGPGDGKFLSVLAAAFDRVIAADTSEEMLRKAESEVSEQSLQNVTLIHGDTQHPQLKGLHSDCVVANMVLHHTPAPEKTFNELADFLSPGGQLVITDLCQHDQNWAREACGDLWLGFDPDDISRWATNNHLQEGSSSYLAQRNGFRVQVRQFTRATTHSINPRPE